MRRVVAAAFAGLGAAVMLPGVVVAHSLVGRLESPLPLVVYLAGAGLAVALSFLFVLLRGVGPSGPAQTQTVTVPAWSTKVLRAIGLLGWLWVVAQTIAGGSSAGEVTSLILWVYGWVGIAIASAFVGPIWSWLDPFSTLFDLGASVFRRLGVEPWTPADLPSRFAYWPAVAGFAFVVWLELVFRGLSLGVVLLAYTVITLLAMAQFGRDTWRERGETFSVWFALLGRLAPIAPDGVFGGRRLRIRPFASGVFEPGWTPALIVLAAFGIGSIIYDGLSQTQPYFAVFGLPNVAMSTIILAIFLGTIALLALSVARLVGVSALGAGLVPIAVGYLVAHYFTYLLLDGQRIVVAASDPLQQGWDLFGTAFYEPTLLWFPASLIWTVQLASVVGGHVVGAWAGHAEAARSGERGREVRLRQAPVAVLMVGLTVLTLWSLGQAIVKEPGTGPVTNGTATRA